MRYSLLSYPAIALGLAACSPEAATDSGNADPVLGTSTATAVTTGSWRIRAAYPTNIYEAETASITDPATGRSTLYVIGGRGDRRHFDNAFRAVRAYDVSANTWQSRAQLPLRLFGANGAVEINGKIYMSGGLTTSFDTVRRVWRASRLGSLYVYDPSTDKWTRRKDLPYTSAYGVSAAYGGQLYAAVFCEKVEICGDGELLRYNPSTNSWAILGRTPHSPAFAGAGFVSGKFYLVDMDGHLDIYDVATNRWSTGPLAPFYQVDFCPSTSATLQARLYLVGCHRNDDLSGIYPMLVFAPRTGAWSEAAAPPIPALGHWWNLTRVVVNGRPGLELIGGQRPDNHAQFMP